MNRALGIFLGAALGLALVECMTPSASGTKTNWFRECDADAACEDALSCICGTCTLLCSEDAGCEEGHCSSDLESAATCGAALAEGMCVPDSSECVELPVGVDSDLGAAIVPTCGGEAALVCESFDSPFPTEYSTWVEPEMSVVIQDCDVQQGAGAIHYSSSAPGQVQTRIPLPTEVSSGPLHARFYVKLGADMVLPDQIQLLEFWSLDDPEIADRASVIVTSGGTPRVYVGSSGSTVEPLAPKALPRDTWLCFELALDIQDQDGTVELLLDGTSVLSASGLDTGPTYPFSLVVIEAQPTTDTVGIDLYVDELVVATAPIGCP